MQIDLQKGLITDIIIVAIEILYQRAERSIHVMGMFEDIVVKAKDGFDIATKKTGEVISVQKMKLSIASINSSISKDYEAVGRLQVDSVKNGTDNSEAIAQIVAEIDKKKAEIEKLEEEISESTNKKNCARCGAKNDAEAAFCNKCGDAF